MSTPAPTARGRRSRQNLLDSAAVVFAERGYAATRIADIVERAGMSQGAFYRHFPDKRAILMAIIDEPLDRMFASTARTEEDSSSDVASLVARNTAFFRAYAEHRHVLRVWRESAGLREPGIEESWRTVRGRFIERIESWLGVLRDRGEIADTDLQLLAECLGAVLEQMAYAKIAMAPRDPTEDELAALGRMTGELWSRALPRPG